MTKVKRTRKGNKRKRRRTNRKVRFDRWDYYWWIEYAFFTLWIGLELYLYFFIGE